MSLAPGSLKFGKCRLTASATSVGNLGSVPNGQESWSNGAVGVSNSGGIAAGVADSRQYVGRLHGMAQNFSNKYQTPATPPTTVAISMTVIEMLRPQEEIPS